MVLVHKPASPPPPARESRSSKLRPEPTCPPVEEVAPKGCRLAMHRKSVAITRAQLGDTHLETVNAISSLGNLLLEYGDSEGASALFDLWGSESRSAEPQLREVLNTCRQTLGDDHPSTLNAIDDLSFLLKGARDYDEAAPLLKEAHESRQRLLGGQHPDTVTSIFRVGSLMQALVRVIGEGGSASRLLEPTTWC